MKKILTLAVVAMMACSTAMAVPAKPGYQTYVQRDGSRITVQAMGDEFFHYFVTSDGLPVDCDDNGDFYYLTAAGRSAVLAHDADRRTAGELTYLQQQRASMQSVETARHKARRISARRKAGQTQVPTIGSPRVPIILVQYTDKKMSNTKQQFEAQYKTGPKSVLQYFTDQSNGKYTPQYDIYGIYDLPKQRAYYGGNKDGNDSCVATMVYHAIVQAGDDIDWSQYDNDGDGEADVCIVVYAGVGEAQASRTVPASVWPCQWDLNSGAYYNDGPGAQTRNGVLINRFAVFNETYGSSDYGTTMDGIGTFCHEFSHCLGLPDFYETSYGHGYYGMGTWSLMNSGCYNGGSISGDTPVGYSAYEKNFMEWIDLIEPVENTRYTLPVFNAKAEATDQAIKITSHLNSNEYFILENRRKQGWDQYIADEGVLITHFTYVADRWEENTPNNEAIQLATIIAADNQASTYSEANDCYGKTNHEFSPTSTPASVLNMRANGTLASQTGAAGTLNKPVTDITINSDGTVSLWYVKLDFSVTPEQLQMKVGKGSTQTAVFTVTGKDMPKDVTLQLNDDDGVFALDKNTLTVAEMAQGAPVAVTFSPQEVRPYNATVDVVCEGVDTLTVTLAAQGLIESETPVMQPADTTAITARSFRAAWTDGSPAQNVKSYTLHVDYKPQYSLLYDKNFTGWQDVAQSYWLWNEFTDIAANLSNYGLEGWTGEYIYSHNGYMQLGNVQSGWSGSNEAGKLATPQFDLSGYDGKVTLIIDAKAQTAGSTLTIKAMDGASQIASQNVTMTTTQAQYVQVLDANASAKSSLVLSTATGKPVQVYAIKVYAGDYSQNADQAPMLVASEQGDSLHRVIEGITEHQYTVQGLRAYGTFDYWVEAVYVDDTHSAMSNIQTVVLRDVTVTTLTGDVNADGSVDIADANILINIMLGKDNADNYAGRAYVTPGDQIVDITDVNTVINIMLGKQ